MKSFTNYRVAEWFSQAVRDAWSHRALHRRAAIFPTEKAESVEHLVLAAAGCAACIRLGASERGLSACWWRLSAWRRRARDRRPWELSPQPPEYSRFLCRSTALQRPLWHSPASNIVGNDFICRYNMLNNWHIIARNSDALTTFYWFHMARC
jgi:hypothetical protein